MTEEELMQRIVSASLPVLCAHGSREGDCVYCENKRLAARVEELENDRQETATRIREWEELLQRLEKELQEIGEQAAATVGALQQELKLVVGENMQAARAILRLENELGQSLEENRALQTQIQALTEETNV